VEVLRTSDWEKESEALLLDEVLPENVVFLFVVIYVSISLMLKISFIKVTSG
jgi:hypothetical protein